MQEEGGREYPFSSSISFSFFPPFFPLLFQLLICLTVPSFKSIDKTFRRQYIQERFNACKAYDMTLFFFHLPQFYPLECKFLIHAEDPNSNFLIDSLVILFCLDVKNEKQTQMFLYVHHSWFHCGAFIMKTESLKSGKVELSNWESYNTIEQTNLIKWYVI